MRVTIGSHAACSSGDAMTPAPRFAQVLPPGPSPARPTTGESATDLAGLFALLLAGMQPVQADVAPSADPNARAAPTPLPALAGDFARAPALATQPLRLLVQGTIGPQAPSTAPAAPVPSWPVPVSAARALPPALQVPAQAGSGQDSALWQLAPSDPDAGLPEPASARSPARAMPAPALHPTLADPSPELTLPRVTAAPLSPTIGVATRPAPDSFGTLQRASAPAVGPDLVPIALAADGKLLPAPGAWSLQTSPPRAVTNALVGEPRAPSSAGAASRSIAAPGPKLHRALAPLLAPTSGTPGPAPDQTPAEDQAWLEPSMEASDRAVARFEHAATDPGRAPAPGRAAPLPPMLQVGVQIARAVPARIDRLYVQLEPAALGRVEVRLEFHRDNQVSAVIAAERPDTLDALQRDARVLERSLHQAGLRLDSDGLTFSLKREQADDQPHGERRLASRTGDLGDQPLLAARGHEPPLLQWSCGLGALDIRV
jgi:flagellar hook-length control protein FliK